MTTTIIKKIESKFQTPASPKASTQNNDLIFSLKDEYRDWILDAGQEMEKPAGETFIEGGKKVDAFYFLIEGLLKVHPKKQQDKTIAIIGPGQLLGEMSFVERVPASVSVSVVERAMLLKIPFLEIEEKMAEEVAFQADFQQALMKLLSARLRATSGKLNTIQHSEQIFSKAENTALFQAVEEVKSCMFKANEYEIKKQKGDFHANAFSTGKSIQQLYQVMNDTIGDAVGGNQEEKDALGYKIQQELAPYFLMSNFLKRSYTKPRGYAGDYKTIADTYDDIAKGNGLTGEMLDRIALDSPAAVAVKNRRGLLSKEIFKTVKGNQGATTNITTFACGPAQELFDVYDKIENPKLLKADLIDIDLKALAFVNDKVEQKSFAKNIKLHHENLIYLALGRKNINLAPQDLVYSIGLIDYFNDQLVVKLINYAHQILKPGGRIILGNFHNSNPMKALMDYVLDWRLIHRSEEDMHRLFEASDFGKGCSNIVYEAQGINMFASCVK